jgi:hypothetical protein
MTSHDVQVERLARDGRITPAEADRLRAALHDRRGRWARLRNPVEHLHPGLAMILAFAVVAASLAISRAGIRFDGAFDVHRAMAAPAWRVAILDQSVAVVLTSLVFWLVSLVTARRGRWQDFAVAVAIARVPNVLVAIWLRAVLPAPDEVMRQVTTGVASPAVMIGAVMTLPFVVWLFAWLYHGFATSAGMNGARAVGAFIVAAIVAEVASKVALLYLL